MREFCIFRWTIPLRCRCSVTKSYIPYHVEELEFVFDIHKHRVRTSDPYFWILSLSTNSIAHHSCSITERQRGRKTKTLRDQLLFAPWSPIRINFWLRSLGSLNRQSTVWLYHNIRHSVLTAKRINTAWTSRSPARNETL